MQLERSGLVPIGEAVSGLDDELVPALRDASAPGAAPLHRGRSGRPTCQGPRNGPRPGLHGSNDGAVLVAAKQPRATGISTSASTGRSPWS